MNLASDEEQPRATPDQSLPTIYNLLTSLDIAALLLDQELRIQFFTPRARELFSLLPADQGKPLTYLAHQLGEERLPTDATQVLTTQTPLEREIGLAAGRWCLMRLLPYHSLEPYGPEGPSVGLISTFVEITSLKRTEQALRESEERARFMVENVKEYAIFAMDQAGLVVAWNQGAERILGYTNAEILGQPGALVFTPEDRARGVPAEEMHNAVSQGQAMDERWHVRKDESRFWGSGVMTALWDNRGELRGFVKMMRDNTERKQGEAALLASQAQLQALNTSLAERIEESTAQVRRLAAELVLAEQKERQRLAQILHDDLEQGLYGLQIQLKILSETLATSQPAVIVDSIQPINEILSRTIQLSRQLTIDLSPSVLPNEGLAEMLHWLVTHVQQHYQLEVEIIALPMPYQLNSEISILLFQLVRELLFNVVKHAGVKQARIEIQAESGNLTIQVIDEGQGFDVEAISLGAASAGYGLYSVRERLALLGGQLVIASVRGHGTRAMLHLPLLSLNG